VAGPQQSDAYERGYLCGIVRGDGNLASYACDRPARTNRDAVHRFRLALCDEDALDRADRYLFAHGVRTTRFAFHAGSDRMRPAQAIRTQAQSQCDRIRDLIEWPLNPDDEWRRGFLAGIFDAEGSGNAVIRISNTDETILRWIETCLAGFGFQVRERPNANGCMVVRLRGGLRERLRFFHLVDPAIRRKPRHRRLGAETDARTAVVSIEPLKTMRPYDITTGTGDFIADGVVSHNCFARPTHAYLDFDAGRDFEREIVVKVNVPEVVRAELTRPSWKGEHVAMGTNTDPYQWVESRYKLMPGIWEAMRDARNPCSILTKSPLLLRDIDLMKEIAQVTQIHANLSIPTLDAKAWRDRAPYAAPQGTAGGGRRAQPGSRAITDAFSVDDQPVSRMLSCLYFLLRPAHPHLPRPERRPRLREGDRGEGQRPRGPAPRATPAVVGSRACRSGDQHGPLPVGRGPLQADARHLGGSGRERHAGVDPHEVAASAA